MHQLNAELVSATTALSQLSLDGDGQQQRDGQKNDSDSSSFTSAIFQDMKKRMSLPPGTEMRAMLADKRKMLDACGPL